MCLPSAPSIPTPTPVQDAKAPDSIAAIRKVKKPVGGGSLLTSPSGVSLASQNTGGTSLLGG